ncbi:MAG: hypothetical protein AB8B71_06155 [Paracoccaceae bacterium]
MSTYVPDAVQAGLDAARTKRLKKASKLRLVTPDGDIRVLRMWESGFSVALEDARQLRGFVGLFDGARMLFQCLIVASQEEGAEMQYEFKRMTAVSDFAPRDFVSDLEIPVALIRKDKLSA